MELLALFYLLLAALLAGLGLAIGLVICAFFAGLLGVCIISISVIVGFSSGKVLAGLRALFAQLGVLAGAVVGAVTALILAETWPQISHHGVILLMGGATGATGAFGGLMVALLAHRAVQMATDRFPKLRLPRTTLIPAS